MIIILFIIVLNVIMQLAASILPQVSHLQFIFMVNLDLVAVVEEETAKNTLASA